MVKRTILVTGNLGYVGSVLVRELRDSFPDSRLIGVDPGFFAHILTSQKPIPELVLDQQIYCDVRSLPEEDLEGVDTIISMAAISNDPMGNRFERATMSINYEGTIRLAKAAKERGVRSFVFASSCSMYGSADGEFRTEESPVSPLTAYARSKALAEQDLSSLASETFTVTSLRFATACGMSERLRLDLVLNDFVAGALARRKVLILSDGSPWRPLIHVKDMAKAVIWAANRTPDTEGPFLTVNVGSNEANVQVKDLAIAVTRIVPNVEVVLNPNGQPDRRSYKVSFDKFKRLAPRHQPSHSLNYTISELCDGLKSLGFADPDFRETSFMRLKVLTDLLATGILNEQLEYRKIRPTSLTLGATPAKT